MSTTSFSAGSKGCPCPGANHTNLWAVLQHNVLRASKHINSSPHNFLFLSTLLGPALGPHVPAPHDQDHVALALAIPPPKAGSSFLSGLVTEALLCSPGLLHRASRPLRPGPAVLGPWCCHIYYQTMLKEPYKQDPDGYKWGAVLPTP